MCIAIKKVEPLGWHLFLLQKITILYLFYTWKVQGQFIAPPKDGIFQWTATVLNINPGYNEKLLPACKPLKEYAILIETIKEYRQKYDEEDVSKIQKIYDIAKEFAPDYNVEKIMAKLG